MRIFSKERDYYDCIVGTGGFDDTIIYNRKYESEIFKTNKKIKLTDSFYCKYKTVHLSARILFICGVEYRAIIFRSPKSNNDIVSYTYIELLENLKANDHADIVKRIESEIKKFKRQSIWTYYSIHYPKFFENVIFTESEIKEMHIKYNSPILSIRVDNIVSAKLIIEMDTNLKELQFQRVLEPWVIFQEIEMYLSGVLCNRKDGDVTISDKDLIKQHGYNNVSFRKLPTPKGKKKRPKEI